MKYLLNAHPWTNPSDFTIEKVNGDVALRVEGNLFSRRQKVMINDQYGLYVGKIEKKLFSLFPIYTVYRDRTKIASISKKPSLFKTKWEVFTLEGDYLVIKGNFFDYEYAVYQGKKRVSVVSKKLFKWPDTYGILVPDENPAYLFLSIAIVVDLINAVKVKP